MNVTDDRQRDRPRSTEMRGNGQIDDDFFLLLFVMM